jgi:hypothetical protein
MRYKMKTTLGTLSFCLLMGTSLAFSANDESEMRAVSPSIILFDIPSSLVEASSSEPDITVETAPVERSDGNAALVNSDGRPTATPILVRPAVDKNNENVLKETTAVAPNSQPANGQPDLDVIPAPAEIKANVKNAAGPEITAWPTASEPNGAAEIRDEFGQNMPNVKSDQVSATVPAGGKIEMPTVTDVMGALKKMVPPADSNTTIQQNTIPQNTKEAQAINEIGRSIDGVATSFAPQEEGIETAVPAGLTPEDVEGLTPEEALKMAKELEEETKILDPEGVQPSDVSPNNQTSENIKDIEDAIRAADVAGGAPVEQPKFDDPLQEIRPLENEMGSQNP